ncbi:hypothetical protein QTN25_004504 [Entamoeba marina]
MNAHYGEYEVIEEETYTDNVFRKSFSDTTLLQPNTYEDEDDNAEELINESLTDEEGNYDNTEELNKDSYTDEDLDEEINDNDEMIELMENLLEKSTQVQQLFLKEQREKEELLLQIEDFKQKNTNLLSAVDNLSDATHAAKALIADNEKLLNELELERKQHSLTIKRLAELEDGSQHRQVDGTFLCVMEMSVISGEIVQSRVLHDIDKEIMRLQNENKKLLQDVCDMKLERQKWINKELDDCYTEIANLRSQLSLLNTSTMRNEVTEHDKIQPIHHIRKSIKRKTENLQHNSSNEKLHRRISETPPRIVRLCSNLQDACHQFDNLLTHPSKISSSKDSRKTVGYQPRKTEGPKQPIRYNSGMSAPVNILLNTYDLKSRNESFITEDETIKDSSETIQEPYLKIQSTTKQVVSSKTKDNQLQLKELDIQPNSNENILKETQKRKW